jgi:hypothetical protein
MEFFFVSFLVPNVFSAFSHQVLKCVCQDVFNSTWVLSHTVSPKFNCPEYILKRSNQKGEHLFLFCNWGPKRCFYWGHPKTFLDGPMNMASLKNKKIKVVSANMVQLV